MQVARKKAACLYFTTSKNVKKFQKTLKNLLTNKSDCDIITKLSAKKGSETVIENWTTKREVQAYKYVQERNSKISERTNTTQTKVREAKIALG